ncbi:hypothetical protein CYG48_05955 [Neorhizobium sp. SOG26]|uniref:HIRAN domain-containing protein n=1 Tax=Neorhizobium sp. SOG26 TaxID=2060726 RepID=UPI000E5964F1|nr:HIRAN domain-containing protein [Neorhizobium sp. SOG26]AXV15285.1 hypothetical protein CYG48_05955 [Neorhizobium sp. SOG26]
MEAYVDHIVEPDVLLLAWQAPDHMKNRRRWVVAKVDVRSDSWTLRYLSGDEFSDANPDASSSDLLALGFEGYPAFARRINQQYFDKGVREAFMRRLPPRNRPDFVSYLRRFGFRDSASISDAALLAYTEAKLPSDGFSLVGELRNDMMFGDLMLDLAGTRYQDFGGSCPACPGDEVVLKKEPTNPYDPSAIEVLCSGQRMGYVNRLQAPAVGHWMNERSVRALVHRVNGRSGSPKVYVLLQVRPSGKQLAA